MNYRTEDSAAKNMDYKGQKFYLTSNGFMTVLNNKQMFFAYFPADLENISTNFDLNIESDKVYFLYNPIDETNFDSNMNKLGKIIYELNIRPVKACSQEENCPDIPVVDCEEEIQKFFFKEANQTSITQDQNCIVLNAESKMDMDMLIEIINYKILGIMN